jgi:hypothetical protein
MMPDLFSDLFSRESTAMARREATPRETNAPPQLLSTDKRLQQRLLRTGGRALTDELAAAAARLPDLSERVHGRDAEETEAFTRDLTSDKKLRDQRIARQLRGEVRAPQAELLPGDTRD